MGVASLRKFKVLDVTRLTRRELGAAVKLFDAISQKPMLPFNELDLDPVRRELDERFGREVLGLPEPILAADGPLDLLRRKLASEPSIHGGKIRLGAAPARDVPFDADNDAG